jgi:ribosomal protein S7
MVLLKKTLYSKLLGFLIKKGKKKKAKNILDKAFLNISSKTGLSISYILLKVFLNLNTFVEARTIRIKRSSYVVPFSLSLKRRSYLIIKWLIMASMLNKKRVPFVNKIQQEVVLILKQHVSSKALKLKKVNNNKANSNRANIHFRW